MAVQNARRHLLDARVALDGRTNLLTEIITYLDASGPQDIRQIRRQFSRMNGDDIDSLVRLLVERGAVRKSGTLYQSA